MPQSHRPYAPEFRRQMVDLVRSGRTPEALSREFEPTAQAIWNWVRQADRDEGRRHDGPTNAEREELTRLRRENRQLRQERDILAKAAAWFARETAVMPSGAAYSWARPRPSSRPPPWHACSACRPPATTLGVLASLQHAPAPTMRCSDDCARSMLSHAEPMVHLEFMPSCVPKGGQSERSGCPG